MLEVLLAILIAGGVLTVMASPLLLRDAFVLWRWKRAAKLLGLGFRRGGLMGGDKMNGVLDGFTLNLDNLQRGGTEVRVSSATRRRIPHDLMIEPRRLLSFGAGPIETGDAELDRAFEVSGAPADALSSLGREARAALLAVMKAYGHGRAGISVSGGEVRFRTAGVIKRDKDLRALVDALTRIANALATEKPPQERLRELALSDDEPTAFRIRALRMLLDHFLGSGDARMAFRAALTRPSAEERLTGAIGLGSDPSGLSEARALARDEAVAPELRVRALNHLVPRLTPPDALAAEILAASGSHQPELRRFAALVLGQRKISGAKDVLLAMMLDPDYPTLAAVAAGLGTAGARGDREIEVALLGLLDHPSSEVRVAASKSLGEVGTIAAVEPLSSIARAIFADLDAKRTAKEAIERIQSAVPEAGPGRLSLLEAGPSAEGALSIRGEQGALAIKNAKGG